MEFTLTYQGLLKTKASAADKQEIRRQFHPQLRELWRQRLPHRVPGMLGGLDLTNMPLNASAARTPAFVIAKRHEVSGIGFVPLVTDEVSLGCKVEIFFLAKSLHQRILTNCDLDNRLKSLFDGLRTPSNVKELGGWTPTADEIPFYCLVSNDALITDIKISGDTLLDPTVTNPEHYNVVIRVETRLLRLTQMNADLM